MGCVQIIPFYTTSWMLAHLATHHTLVICKDPTCQYSRMRRSETHTQHLQRGTFQAIWNSCLEADQCPPSPSPNPDILLTHGFPHPELALLGPGSVTQLRNGLTAFHPSFLYLVSREEGLHVL